MPTWKYKAVRLDAVGSDSTSGELVAEDAASLRAQLRRAGLQVIDLKLCPEPVWKKLSARSAGRPLADLIASRLRSRRVSTKAELYDSLATMVDAGLTLLDALGSIGTDRKGGLGSLGRSLAQQLREGVSLANAMTEHPSWFDAAEIAIIRAGEHRGEIAAALTSLAERQHRSGELSGKLVSALAYPAIVALVGVGVVIFLSTKTLPQITAILRDAEIAVPPLTAATMGFGQALLVLAPWLLLAVPVLLVPVLIAMRVSTVRSLIDRIASSLTPRLMRRATVGDAMTELAQLTSVGVPFTEALRIVSQTVRGIGVAGFRSVLRHAATQIEHGTSVAAAFEDPNWFDDELRRLIATGETAGELPTILERVGERYRRSARRAIDRLSAILEPTVILMLAVGVGLVVMAAIQPLIRLQEVL